MADLLTHSLTFSKENVREYFLKPLFTDADIKALVNVRTDIKSSEKLDFVGTLEKITKTYAQGDGFTTSTGVTVTQKTLTVVGMKAEVKQNGKAFLNWVKQAMLAQGVDENNINGTVFEQIILQLFMKGLKNDLIRQIFFNDTVKETMTNTGGVYSPSGTADDDYNDYLGFWPRIINAFDDSTIAASQKVDLNVVTTYQTTAAVKGKKTSTLTGTSGTANININGVNYLATFATDLTTTAANFVTAYAAIIAARDGKCVVTSSGAGIIVEAGIPGMNVLVTSTNVSGNLDATEATTTAAVINTTLVSGGANTAFGSMWDAMTPELREYVGNGAVIMCTTSMADNYMKTLEALNGSEVAYGNLVNGQRQLNFRGIPILIRQDWDVRIANDMGYLRRHRALLTVPENLVIGTDGVSDEMSVEMFYDQVKQNNHFRAEYKAGTQYVHEKLIVAAY